MARKTTSQKVNVRILLSPKINIPTKREGTDWMYGFRKRNSDLRLRKPENTSDARPFAFNKFIRNEFYGD